MYSFVCVYFFFLPCCGHANALLEQLIFFTTLLASTLVREDKQAAKELLFNLVLLWKTIFCWPYVCFTSVQNIATYISIYKLQPLCIWFSKWLLLVTNARFLLTCELPQYASVTNFGKFIGNNWSTDFAGLKFQGLRC